MRHSGATPGAPKTRASPLARKLLPGGPVRDRFGSLTTKGLMEPTFERLLSDSPTIQKVIVAEDQPEMRSLIAARFRKAGYDVVEVSDGNVLWEELRQCILDEDNPREPDLIVSDVRMPGRTGLEVLALIRQTDWATPVILITAFGEKDVHEEAYRLGAAHVFRKPFDIRELLKTAGQLIGPA